MILTAHQPVYLPWLGLFHKIALADSFVSLDHVQFLKQDWNNRNKIKVPHKTEWLTVPVHQHGYMEKSLTDIEIDNRQPWQRKHWQLIKRGYERAPYYSRYAGFFEDVYKDKKWENLVELNDFMLRWFLKELKILTNITSSSTLNLLKRKSQLIEEMCQKSGAKTYIFGEMGKNYADLSSFKSHGINIVFQEYNHPVYPQMHGEFVSNLSILDLLFNCGEESRDILMSNNISRNEISQSL